MHSDILIVGGGVIGLTLARELHKKGNCSITVVDRGPVGMEASFAAAGLLAPQAEMDRIDPFFELGKKSRDLYPRFADDLRRETGIDIELDRSGTLYVAFSDDDTAIIRTRLRRQKEAGLRVDHLTAKDLRREEPFISPDVREGLLFHDDWQVENRVLLDALKAYAQANGIELIENSEVLKVLANGGKVAGAESRKTRFESPVVILTTGAWTSLIKTADGEVPVPGITPVRGQMIRFHTAKRLFGRVIYSPRGYLVPRKLGTILAGATEENAGFDKRVTSTGVASVLAGAIELVPGLSSLPIDDSWSGLRPAAPDRLPVIGECPIMENLFVATAHFRNGILMAPETARILAERILSGRDSEVFEEFGPARFFPATATAIG